MPDYSITKLDISELELTQLPDDIGNYTNLVKLNVSKNQLTSLDNLPPTLTYLNCNSNSNKISNLDYLPLILEYLDCSYNKITSLEGLNLPNLQYFYCFYNKYC